MLMNNEDTNSTTWRFARCEWVVNCRTSVGNKALWPTMTVAPVSMFDSIANSFYFSGWWIQPIWKIWVKILNLPPNQGENQKIFELPPPFVCFCCKSPLRHGKTVTEWPLLPTTRTPCHSTPHLTPASWVLHPNLQPKPSTGTLQEKSLVTEQWYIPLPQLFLHSKLVI